MIPHIDNSGLRPKVIPDLRPSMPNPTYRHAQRMTCIADDRPVYANGKCWRCYARQIQNWRN